MSYRLKRSERLVTSVRRIAREEVDSAIEALSNTTVPRETAIHEARKSLKKLRGLLKLVRPELKATYKDENAALRNAARELSELRDAGAMLETFESLASKHGNFVAVEKGLRTAKAELERKLNIESVISSAIKALKQLAQRIDGWELADNGRHGYSRGLKDSYRAGRRAMQCAFEEQTPDAFHEWRKRAKDHWYHSRLLDHVAPALMQDREAKLHQLESALGEDHNLTVLCELLSKDPQRYGGSDVVRVFTALATKEQKRLRNEAARVGAELYSVKPKQLLKLIEADRGEKKAARKAPSRMATKTRSAA